jgi:hypothetical protein
MGYLRRAAMISGGKNTIKVETNLMTVYVESPENLMTSIVIRKGTICAAMETAATYRYV